MKLSRILSILLALTILVSVFVGVAAVANASGKIFTTPTGYTRASDVVYRTSSGTIANWGARGENCVFLSKYADTYYTGSYTYAFLSQKSGGTSQSNAHSSDLYSSLQSMMQAKHDHKTSYDETRNLYRYTDCLRNDTTHISSFYSGKELTGNWDGGSTWNREHTWPKSKGLNGSDENDIMMLRPTWVQENSDRGNTAYGESSGYYDPGESVRGDCARIVLYVYTRWGNTKYMWGTEGVMESMDVLLRWMEEDPVDTWEMGRNDAVESITGVRNVFVDYPEYAWLLFGKSIPAGMVTPSGEAKNSAPQYTVTARSNDEAFGTVSQNDRTITATPENGYMVSGYEVSPAGAATVTQSGNTFTVSNVNANCTVTIIFAPRSVATITYIVPKGVTVSGTTTCYVGDTVTLASANGTPTDGEGYTFFGWSVREIIDTTVQPSVQKAGASYTVKAAQTTFYGVFSYVDGTTTHYLTNLCKHEHTHTETVEPTCTKDGAVNTVCDDCGAVIASTPIAKTGHDYEDTVVEPTCYNKGYTLHTCKNCGDSYKNTYTAALGHAYVSKVTKPATATEYGVLTYTCSRCGSSYTEVIPATGEDQPTVHDCPCDDYSDLDNTEWYHAGVDLMLNMGYMNGVGNGKFDPSGTTTRAMIVTILWRIAGQPAPETENTFRDVAAGQWYTDAITWAAENDVVNGVGDGRFDPEGKITREQMATILFRYAGSLGADTSKRAELSGYPDGGKTADWASDAVQWAVAEGIIYGSEGKLLPQDSATRAQVATILYRSMELITE